MSQDLFINQNFAQCFWTFFPQTSFLYVYFSVWKPWVEFQSCRHPPSCAARKWVSERRGGATLGDDNVRRLSNPASMTLPVAGLLDYQPFTASLTPAGPFTMETPHHSHSHCTSSQSRCRERWSGISSPEPWRFKTHILPVIKADLGSAPRAHRDNWPCAWLSVIVLLVWWCDWLT